MLDSNSDIYVINYYKGLINVRVTPEIVILNDEKNIY